MFNKVNVSEKKVIFRSLANRRAKIIMKSIEEEINHLIAIKNVEDKVLECGRIQLNTAEDKSQGAVTSLQNNQHVILNFNFNEDRYFMQTKMILAENRVLLDLTSDLFVLQRRKSPRIDLPANYPHQIRIIEYKGKVVFFEGRVIDFGAGGCRIELMQHEPRFSISDPLALVLSLSHRSPLTLSASIRHVIIKEEGTEVRQIFGVQFLGLGPIMENKMLSLLMELQKELFTKFNG